MIRTYLITIIVLSFTLGITTSCNKSLIKRSERTSQSPNQALLLTWHAENHSAFWAQIEQELSLELKKQYDSDRIAYVLPYEHKPLQHPDKKGTWTNCLLIGLHDDHSEIISKSIIGLIKSSSLSNHLVAVDKLNLQEGLDMFYSAVDGVKEEHKLEQIVEYVFSEPSARKKYYGEQYIFSGPAMQELHKNNNAGRFIGFEVAERLYGDDFPAWDLVHVVGFTKEQSERATPIFMKIWDHHAERAFGEGMTFLKKKAEWDKIRLNIKSNAKQNMNITLPLKSSI